MPLLAGFRSWNVFNLILVLLLGLALLPPLPGLPPPLGGAEGIERQQDPTRCDPFGNDWTLCANAFLSNDTYAYTNDTPVNPTPRSQGPNFPAACVSELPGNIGWGNPNRCVADDNRDAATGRVENGESSRRLRSTNHGFSIPGGSTIDGIQVEVEKRSIDPDPPCQDLEARLTKGGTPVGEDRSLATNWPTTRTVVTYGGSTDLWGTTWTPANINDSGFGFGIRTDAPNSCEFRVDFIRITVAFTEMVAGPGRNDTAWQNFGLNLNASDTIDRVEIGVEWFRTSPAPILNVTVSWDGGVTWATNVTATNKSADDDIVEYLDFSSVTAWDAGKLNNTNFQARVGTNGTGARLDFVSLRVNYLDAALELSAVSSPAIVDPGDAVVHNATLTSVGTGPAQNILLTASVDPNATYVTSTPLGTFDSAARMIRWTLASLTPGGQVSFEWVIEVNPGTPDLATVTSLVRVEGEDSGGLSLTPGTASTQATVRAPVFAPLLLLDKSSAERDEEVLATLYYNNTGSGTALRAWTNWSLGGHYELVSLLPALPYTAVPDGFRISLTNVIPGPQLVDARLRVIRGMEDGLELTLGIDWTATDGNGNLVIDTLLPSMATLRAPSVDLTLAAAAAPLNVGSVFILNLTIGNAGSAAAIGRLNLTLPEGVEYVADNGTFGVTLSDGQATWELASLPGRSNLTLGVELLVTGSLGVESFRFTLDYSDGKGSPSVTAFSNAVSVQVLPGSASLWPWWWFALPALVAIPLLALVLRRRRGNIAIEEVFVMDHRGLLIQHLSRTLTPEKDQDLLAAMLKTMQDFVKEAFSKREDVPMRSLRFGEKSILMEQGPHLYVAVVYQGKDDGSLETRLSQLTEKVESEYGEFLESWVGDMDEVKGIRDLIPSLWEKQRGLLGGLLGR